MGARKEEHTAHWQLSQSQQLVSRFQGLSPAAKEGMGLESRRLPSLHVDLGLFGGHHPPLHARIGGESTQQYPHPVVTVMISQSNMFGSVFSVLSPRAINRPKGAAVGFVSVWCIGGSPGGLLDP